MVSSLDRCGWRLNVSNVFRVEVLGEYPIGSELCGVKISDKALSLDCWLAAMKLRKGMNQQKKLVQMQIGLGLKLEAFFCALVCNSIIVLRKQIHLLVVLLDATCV